MRGRARVFDQHSPARRAPRLLLGALLLVTRVAAAETPLYVWGAQRDGSSARDEELGKQLQMRLAQRGRVSAVDAPAQGCTGLACLSGIRKGPGWLLGVTLRTIGTGERRETQGRVWLANLPGEPAAGSEGGIRSRASLDFRGREGDVQEAALQRAAALVDSAETLGLGEETSARPRFCGQSLRGETPRQALPATRERVFVVVLTPRHARGETRKVAQGLARAAAEHLRHLNPSLEVSHEVLAEDPAQGETLVQRRYPKQRGLLLGLGPSEHERRALQTELWLVGFEGGGRQQVGALDLPSDADAGTLELQALLGAKLADKLTETAQGGAAGVLLPLPLEDERCTPFTIALSALPAPVAEVMQPNAEGRDWVPLRDDLKSGGTAKKNDKVTVGAPRWPWIGGLALGAGALAVGGAGLALVLIDGRVQVDGGVTQAGVPGAARVLHSKEAGYGLIAGAGVLALSAILTYTIPTVKNRKAKTWNAVTAR